MFKRTLIFLSAWVYVCKWLWRRLFASRIFSFLIVWNSMMFFFFVLICVLLFRKQNQKKKNTYKTSRAWNNENVWLYKCFTNEPGRYWYPLTCTTSLSPPPKPEHLIHQNLFHFSHPMTRTNTASGRELPLTGIVCHLTI